MLKPTIFREYDIRGIADAELLSDGIEQLGKAVGTYLLRRNGRLVNVGRDCRLSSERLRDALVRGLKAAGCEVTDLGVVPTPLLYYSVFHLKAGGAVMITGSHNPPEYNGFKVVSGESTIHGEQIQELRRMIETGDLARGEGSERAYDVVTPYVNEIAAQFHYPRRVKVVFDAGNGTAGPVVHRIAEKLNCEATELFFEPDGHFPNHHPDPTIPANLAPLAEAVREGKADLGVAFDGDADRIGAIDDAGNIIWGDQLLVLYSREILARKPGATVIGEVKCSQSLYDDIRKHGGNGIMWRTGHSLIKAKMKETAAEIAGEMSGHIFFRDRYYGFDDAIYASCRLMEIIAGGRPLSEQLADLPKTVVTPEIRVDCPDEIKFEVVSRVTAHFRKLYDVVDVDGARVLFSEGWGLLRASNTQHVLVMRFEAACPELLDRYRAEMEEALAAIRREVEAAAR
jgi:phosphomannomutase/phosphoglucomutase